MMRHRVTFRLRASPLPATAVLAEGDVAAALRVRLLDRTPEELARLEGVRGAGRLTLIGATEALPWCAGVRYFASQPGLRQLLLPVELEADVPAAWLLAALPGEGARLVLPQASGVMVMPLVEARPLRRDWLETMP